MSTALRIAHGTFGRVALLDMDCSLVRHAHPHCHVLLKVEGADTQFVVGDTVYPLTDRPRCWSMAGSRIPMSTIQIGRARVILALYIEPEWLMAFPAGLGGERRTRLLQPSLRRSIAADPRPRDGSGGRHDGASGCAGRA